MNPEIIGKQVFMERRIINGNKVTTGYHIEYLLPIKILINYKPVYFALILRENQNKEIYEGMSIITRENAYSNSRLIGEVTLQWLKPFVNINILRNGLNTGFADNDYTSNCQSTKNSKKMEIGDSLIFACPYIHPFMCIDCILTQYKHC